jgi:hypothetical protein
MILEQETLNMVPIPENRGVALSPLFFAMMSLVAACGSGGNAAGTGGTTSTGGAPGSGGATSSGGTGGQPASAFRGPCSNTTRLGPFSVLLQEEVPGNPAYTKIAGGIYDKVNLAGLWKQEGETVGGCGLWVGPNNTCSPSCASPQVCVGSNQCAAAAVLQSVGIGSIVGLGSSAISLAPLANNSYSESLSDPYPPFVHGAAIELNFPGAAGPAFKVAGQGFQPLNFEGKELKATRGADFSFTWMPPAKTGPATIQATMEIGHHGGVAARVECDFPENGSAKIPASLVSALMDKGVHGYPQIVLSRRVVDSTQVTGGCIDLTVASDALRFLIACPTAGNCQTSCTVDGDCMSPQTCQDDYVCGM